MKNDSCTPGKPLEDDLSMSDIHQHLITLEALWIIDEDDGGPYVGQWAMQACAENGIDWLPLGWVPEEDISVLTPNA